MSDGAVGAVYDETAERALLGCLLMLDEDGYLAEEARRLLDENMFHRERNRRIFRSIARVADRGARVDPVTVLSDLKQSGEYEGAACGAYLAELADAVQDAGGFHSYVELVSDLADQRWNAADLIRPNEVRNPACTDLGNSERFVAWVGANARYVRQWRMWLVWDGRRWSQDRRGQIVELAKRVVRGIHEEAAAATDPDRRKELGKWAVRSEARTRIDSMLALAETDAGIAITPEQLDADGWKLNVLNGTLNLRTGELERHRRHDLITKLVPVAYDADARAPAWTAFLDRIMAGDQERLQFLRRAVGYTLTGDTREQVLFFLLGRGANGKSTFLETLRALLGDFARTTDFNTLKATRRDGPRNDIAALQGARFVASSEVEEGSRMSEVVVKQLTGGDTISARRLYSDFFEFTPTFKIWIAANHRPTIRGDDDAIWRRIRLIPFDVVIPPAERDPHLPATLKEELAGILTWAVRGCQEWLGDGLGEPVAVQRATAAFRTEMDVLGQFLGECCLVGGDYRSRFSEIWDRYREWAEDAGYKRYQTKQALGRAFSDKGFDVVKVQGEKGRSGLQVKPIRTDGTERDRENGKYGRKSTHGLSFGSGGRIGPFSPNGAGR